MPIQAPQWTDYLNCPVCCREFGPPPRSPVSLSCGHTLCRHCLKHLQKQCPFDQTSIQVDFENLVTNTAVLQLVGYDPPAQPYHPPCIQSLPKNDQLAYDVIVRCFEHLAVFLKFCGTASTGIANTSNRLSRPMQRKLITVIQCAMTDEEGRGKAARAARSLGERTVTELILQHQNPQQLSVNLWAAVRARGCQFLGPAMQEEVLKLVLLALEDGSALSRKVLVMFVVQRLEPHFPQASKTSIGHVVQLLYRASCFKVSKRESDSSLMQLKEEFRSYESLRREHDAQIVQIATEAGLRIAPDQWSSLLYGDTTHKSHMQSIIDKLQTPASFAQSVQELFIALQRTGDPAQLSVISMHLDRLANIDASPDAKNPSWQQLAEIMTSLKEVVSGLVHFLQQQATIRDVNQNTKHLQITAESSNSTTPATGGSTPTHGRYKVSMCRDAANRSFCPRGNACTFAHTEEELERYRALQPPGVVNGNQVHQTSWMPLQQPSTAQQPFQQFFQQPLQNPFQLQYPYQPFQQAQTQLQHPIQQLQGTPMYPSNIYPIPIPLQQKIQRPIAENNNQSPTISPISVVDQTMRAALCNDTPPSVNNYGSVMHHQSNINVNGLGARMPTQQPDHFYQCYSPNEFTQYQKSCDIPGTNAYNIYGEGIHAPPPPPPLPPPLVNKDPIFVVPYEPDQTDLTVFASDDGSQEQRTEPRLIRVFRTCAPQVQTAPRKPHPEPVWPPTTNNMFNIQSNHNLRVAANATKNSEADDQELEEELQALERRIDTEFESTD